MSNVIINNFNTKVNIELSQFWNVDSTPTSETSEREVFTSDILVFYYVFHLKEWLKC